MSENRIIVDDSIEAQDQFIETWESCFTSDLPNWVISTPDLDPYEKVLFIAIFSHHKKSKDVYLSKTTMMRMTALKDTKLKEALKRLLELKLIRRVPGKRTYRGSFYYEKNIATHKELRYLDSDQAVDRQDLTRVSQAPGDQVRGSSRDQVRGSSRDHEETNTETNIETKKKNSAKAPPPPRDDLLESKIDKVIDNLNATAKKKFSKKSDNNRKYIRARLNEGHPIDDCLHVIKVKTKEWLNNPDMNQYLNPETLFRPKNFEKYLNIKSLDLTPEEKEAKIARYEKEREERKRKERQCVKIN